MKFHNSPALFFHFIPESPNSSNNCFTNDFTNKFLIMEL